MRGCVYVCVRANNLCILGESCWRRVFFPQRVSFFASAVCVYTRIVYACVFTVHICQHFPGFRDCFEPLAEQKE